ncbi:hypothetical protein RC62_1705 [Flavobacterium aquidurense]|uniref:Uncharacterized protein n=1 Tax=Flavobacterium aquidurense TaxID=362413 RepID=A0A0Q0W1Y1_9FLAO|nr:hypothetical protein RC62_1705 [Flavobacterium aquidurense]
MTTKKLMPAQYGGDIGNNRNALNSVGHLKCVGFIFPNCSKL